MLYSEPTLLCDLPAQPPCEAGSLCSVVFEAPSLPALGQQLERLVAGRGSR